MDANYHDDEDDAEILESGPESGSLSPQETFTFQVEEAQNGWRLDLFLVHHLSSYSRVLMRRAISEGNVRVDDSLGKPSYRLKTNQRVTVTPPEIPHEAPIPEDIPLDIIYEDDWVVAVNKPPGMVVHPARGHWAGTLASALQFRYDGTLSGAGGPTRPGIVHRLDRDTSGIILVARNDLAHARLSAQFEQRHVEKEYLAICLGNPLRDRDWVDAPIGPHTHSREKKMIRFDSAEARPARTFYEVEKRYQGFAIIRAFPKTGRTHQIRLHLTHIGLPILCDALYGNRTQITLEELRCDHHRDTQSILLSRQALHAHRIRFTHPDTGKIISLEAPIPEDLKSVINVLEQYRTIS